MEVLPVARPRTLVDKLDLQPKDRRSKGSLVQALARVLPDVLPRLFRHELRDMCVALGLDSSGRTQNDLIQRIVGSNGHMDRAVTDLAQLDWTAIASRDFRPAAVKEAK